ncbi:MAG: chitin deacetylase [Alphaproteobacteria bacterium]|nr:chitin deacetylase [Alphaproteobacteria bacterium]
MSDTAPPTDHGFRRPELPPTTRPWPDGARLALSIVVNVEEGAELSVAMGDEANEFVYEAGDKIEGACDLCMESHYEYGPRAGWPRIRTLLKQHGVRATLSACGRALVHTPWIAQEAIIDGHEVAAHGWRWERHVHMAEADERRAIARTVRAITAAASTPPVGWHTRSATSINTRRLLVEHGGFLYDSNAYNDDMPHVVEQSGVPHVVLPYAFNTNDMRFQPGGGFVFARDFARYCIDAVNRLHREGAEAPRMMSVGLHLRIIGRPGRIDGLDAFLAHAAALPGVWFARRDQIAASWRAACGLPPWTARATPSDFAP